LFDRLEGVAGSCQQVSDVPDAFVDRFGTDGEQGGDGDLGQAESVVQDGGQDSVVVAEPAELIAADWEFGWE
jgi:hypothetical protein